MVLLPRKHWLSQNPLKSQFRLLCHRCRLLAVALGSSSSGTAFGSVDRGRDLSFLSLRTSQTIASEHLWEPSPTDMEMSLRQDCVTRMTGFTDVLSVAHLVVAIGWLPLLRVSQCSPSVRRAVHQQGQALILVQLVECGLTLGTTTPLPVGQLAHLLYTLLLSPLLRHDDRRLRKWGPTVPAVECRVGIRHKRQNPPRHRWQRARGRGVARENLPGLFPDNCFDRALAALAVRQQPSPLSEHRAGCE